MSLHAAEHDDFLVAEWNRLNRTSSRFDVMLKTAWTKMVVLKAPDDALLREVITDEVVEVGVETAHVYGMTFDPRNEAYHELIDNLTDGYMKVVNNAEAREKVREILPPGLSLTDRNNRLDVFGLSGREAVRLERMRQKGIGGQRLEAARLDMSVQRGNLVALTESNRIVNATLETVWLENMTITKARRPRRGQLRRETADGKVIPLTSLRGVPSRARKSIVTRKDDRTCDYCEPLEGVRAKVGTVFRTRYGIFSYPPFHPRCRCFMIVRY